MGTEMGTGKNNTVGAGKNNTVRGKNRQALREIDYERTKISLKIHKNWGYLKEDLRIPRLEKRKVIKWLN